MRLRRVTGTIPNNRSAPDIWGAGKETANMYIDDESNDSQYLQETHGQPCDAAAPVVPFECLLTPADRAWLLSIKIVVGGVFWTE